jgi:mono/diheme cytochrome c family protein
MTGSLPGRGTVLALTLLLVGPLVAQESRPKPPQKEAYVGSSLFRTYCTTCHGLSGQGDGPLAEHLRFRPPDLTLIARRNDGKWDANLVARMIDGREPVKGHGGPDMPVWGDAFKSSREGFDEDAVKARIQALVDYLASLQEGSAKPQK